MSAARLTAIFFIFAAVSIAWLSLGGSLEYRTAALKNSLSAWTNFSRIDYPKGTVSSSFPAEPHDGGMLAKWRYDNVRSAQFMGIAMPSRTNAGPIAARMSFFAPVSCLLFFSVLLTLAAIEKVSLHPMHYLFIAAGFFAFHVLMAYLVDVVNIHWAFWICALVSTALVVSYMRLVAGVKFAVIYVGLAQVVYLVGFSYAFFWHGRTGLTVTIGAIVTLFVLMQLTGKIDWPEVFIRPRAAGMPSPGPTASAGGPELPGEEAD